MADPIRVDVGTGRFGTTTAYVRLDPVKLAAVFRGPDGPVARDLMRRGVRVKERAKQIVGVDTGRLRDSIVTRMELHGERLSVFVFTAVPYAYWHHEGSAAVQGKLMVFKAKDGSTVFTMKRKAIPPNRFLVNALPAAKG